MNSSDDAFDWDGVEAQFADHQLVVLIVPEDEVEFWQRSNPHCHVVAR